MSSLPDTCRYFRMFCISLQRSHFCVSIWCHVECDETSGGYFVNRVCLLPTQQAYSCFLSTWGMILHETNHAFCPSSPQKLCFLFFYFFLGALGKTIYLLGCQRDIFSSSVMFHGFVLLFFFLHNFSDCLMRLLFSLIPS